ncbi:ly-6/neurotoxin-like protein 1 [Argopecten irradians]|uniref:ly-6/neurotoxin-like protein 1 n=1 Tax=Argopecten irradians TaxID=31199 RepID=UPI00371B680B
MVRLACGRILLLVGIGLTYNPVSAILCHVCGYNKPTDGMVGFQCVNDTSKLPRPTDCPDDRVCIFDAQFFKKTNELISVTRSCIPPTPERSTNKCLADWTHRQCTFSCNTDLCNNITLNELDRKVANSAHPGTELSFLCIFLLLGSAVFGQLLM